MSEEEKGILIVCAIASVFLWGYWYAVASRVFAFAGGHSARRFLFITPLVCTAILYFILRYLASYDVQEDYRYIAMYLAFGLAWLGFAVTSFGIFGISSRDDAVERRNLAAAVALSGGMVGVLLCFAGGNIGDGPGWYVVLFSAILSTLPFLGLWLTFELSTRVSELITVDRDLAAALRLAGFLIASGLILGRAVAGDWGSVDATTRDFLQIGWPVLPLLIVAILAERLLRPNAENPVRSVATAGAMPAIIYLAVASAYVFGWLDRP